MGPGEYFLTKGRMEVRGGADDGGATAVAVGYGYEACSARHDQTNFVEDSEFYMTFLGPLQFIDEDGNNPGRCGLGTGRRPVGTADRTSVGLRLSRLMPLSCLVLKHAKTGAC